MLAGRLVIPGDEPCRQHTPPPQSPGQAPDAYARVIVNPESSPPAASKTTQRREFCPSIVATFASQSLLASLKFPGVLG